MLVPGVQQSESVLYMYLLFFRFYSHIDHYRVLGRVPCAMGGFLLFIYSMYSSVSISIPISSLSCPSPLSSLVVKVGFLHLWLCYSSGMKLKSENSFERQAKLPRGSYGGPDIGKNKEKGAGFVDLLKGKLTRYIYIYIYIFFFFFPLTCYWKSWQSQKLVQSWRLGAWDNWGDLETMVSQCAWHTVCLWEFCARMVGRDLSVEEHSRGHGQGRQRARGHTWRASPFRGQRQGEQRCQSKTRSRRRGWMRTSQWRTREAKYMVLESCSFKDFYTLQRI